MTANITVAAGESVTCIYTNTKQGSITIIKRTIGGFGGPFGYTTTGGLDPASFNLTTTGEGEPGQDSRTYDNLSPGNYSVTESSLPADWEFTSLTCGVGGTVDNMTANIALAAGESVTCIYTNTLVVEAEDETAWASNEADCCTLLFNPDGGGWATYVEYQGFEVAGKIVGFYAGQTIKVGEVEFSAVSNGEVTIKITLDGWSFQAGSVVAVQGYDSAPSGNPAPGQFANKEPAAGATHTIVVPVANFYAVHAVVE
jgi:hypothetical protein